MTVAGKRIVVTGGARGIGAELAAELRSRGADVVTADISDGADVHCDVSDEAAVDTAFSRARLARRAGQQRGAARQPQDPRPDPARRVGPDVRRQRQGRVPVRPGGRAGDERRRQHRQRRVRDGVHRLARVRPLRRVEGRRGVAHRALANELGGRGIRVNCVAPGFTPTPGSDVLGTYDPARTPLGRVMEPSDLLGTFCYLLSDDSSFVSGQTILVNGGRVPH